jgi:hypothetical protein
MREEGGARIDFECLLLLVYPSVLAVAKAATVTKHTNKLNK